MIKLISVTKSKTINVGGHKLNPSKVREIRAEYSTGNFNMTELASLFNIGRSMVSQIINRKKWKHINDKKITPLASGGKNKKEIQK